MAAVVARPSRQSRSERGQIVVMFALGLIVFLGFAALTVDIGFLLVNHRSYQNATDAAALAGATYLTRPTSDPCADVSGGGSKHNCARAASWTYLRDDLRLDLTDAQIDTLKLTNTSSPDGQVVPTTDGGDSYRIWVSTPPSGAGVRSSMSTVQDETQVVFVRVDRNRDTFIGGVLGLSDFNVSAWATAGIFPNRFAVITLRRGQGSTEIDQGPANTTDIKTAGTGSSLTVVDGDVGGNWGMKLTAGSMLRLVSSSTDPVNVLLVDHESCGNSCWSSGQIQRRTAGGAWETIEPKQLPPFVPDPNYAPPPIPGATWPSGPIDNPSPTLDIPHGDTAPNPFSGAMPSVTINAGDTTGSGGCVGPDGTEATAPRLGPGTYRDLTVRNDSCVILDPVRRFDDPELGMDGEATAGGAWDWIGPGQYPGIYYFTGVIDIRNSALVVGDGVTVIIRPNGGGPAQFSPGSAGVMNLNTGKVAGGGGEKLGAWTTVAKTPYLHNGTQWVYQSALEGDLRLNGVGLALYVLKAQQAGITDNNGTDIIAVNSGAGLSWKGITYAPQDNVAIAGQPSHDGIGQLISWTFTFNGGTDVTQTFDGPGDGFPYLIEPCIQVGGACQ